MQSWMIHGMSSSQKMQLNLATRILEDTLKVNLVSIKLQDDDCTDVELVASESENPTTFEIILDSGVRDYTVPTIEGSPS